MLPSDLPSLEEIRQKTFETFHKRLCLFQSKGVLVILRRKKNGILISGTGSGKTLVFWVPLLFRPKGIQIVVTPLNILGQQNVDDLASVGIRAISLNAKTATVENFKVRKVYQRLFPASFHPRYMYRPSHQASIALS